MKRQYEPRTLQQKLGYLVEECGEVLAATGKTIRWGLESYNPELGPESETNRKWILRELIDLRLAIQYVERALGSRHDNYPPRSAKEAWAETWKQVSHSYHLGMGDERAFCAGWGAREDALAAERRAAPVEPAGPAEPVEPAQPKKCGAIVGWAACRLDADHEGRCNPEPDESEPAVEQAAAPPLWTETDSLKAWESALLELRRKGVDVDVMLKSAEANLSKLHDEPAEAAAPKGAKP